MDLWQPCLPHMSLPDLIVVVVVVVGDVLL